MQNLIHRWTVLLFSLFMPLGAVGCSAFPFWLRPNRADLPPEAFANTPTLEDVIYVVNANTDRVDQLQTEDATLRVEGMPMPALRLNMAYERPRNFRLRAHLSQFTGRELDLGSNNELFWFWIRRDQQPGIYYARHNEFAVSPARQLVAIEPTRLPETLGLIQFKPDEQHIGPTRRENLLEIRSRIPAPRGDATRVVLLDAKYGWIVEQHYYDPNGQLVLSASASEHRYYRNDAVTMPHHVEIRVSPGQPAQLTLQIDVSRYVFNRLSGERADLWSMPRIEGYPAIDITDPGFRPPAAPVAHAPYQAGTVNAMTPYGGAARPGVMSPDAARQLAPTGPGDASQRMVELPQYRGYR